MKTAIQPTREQNYPEWYQQVVKAAELAETSPVRGCMVIRPWGYALWENMQRALDQMFKDTGHENAYFPLFIPLSYLEKEAEHVDGFAKECAVVTHHRLEQKGNKLVPAGPLEEPLVVRPTSETIIGETYSKWVQSYRDLPLLINQWANVVRWEMRTRLFLRTAEFLWQEGHTVHATKEEALEETLKMLDVYADFAERFMAVPVIKGEKTKKERFPGAVSTYTIEAMMQDGKALQSGTSHFLGQNFAKASNIKFVTKEEKEEFAWTTSWGVSTRLVGALVMTHSDDNGLVLPPRLAPTQVVILPVLKKGSDEDKVIAHCEQLACELRKLSSFDEPIRVKVDKRDRNGGQKNWEHIKKGVPFKIEVGQRDIEKSQVVLQNRITLEKEFLDQNTCVNELPKRLEVFQNDLFEKAASFRESHTAQVENVEAFKDYFSNKSGYLYAFADECDDMEKILKPLKVTPRCIPFGAQRGACIFSGKADSPLTLFAKSY